MSTEEVERLRDKFFKECTVKTFAIPDIRKVDMAPHDLFEWFRPYLPTAATQPKKEEEYPPTNVVIDMWEKSLDVANKRANNYQSLYEQSQSKLSLMTERCEAAEKVIESDPETTNPRTSEDWYKWKKEFDVWLEAYQRWQLLKSSTQQTETKSTE